MWFGGKNCGLVVRVLISLYMILDKNWLIRTLALQQKWYVYIDNLIKTPVIYMILLFSSQYPVTWSWWANVEYRMLPFLFRKKKFNYWKDVCSMVKQVGSLCFRWPTKKTKQGEGHANMGCAALEKILGDVKLFLFFYLLSRCCFCYYVFLSLPFLSSSYIVREGID